MALFHVVFNEQSQGERLPIPTKWENVTTVDNPKSARVVELEASSIAEAQKAVGALYGSSATTPVVVADAAWKTS